MLKLQTVFKIRIVYKSGYTHDFEVTEFNYNDENCTWVEVSGKNRPIKLGLTEIAAVFQVGYRTRIKWK